MPCIIFNGEIAWEIPRGRISRRYLAGLYLPPEGWQVAELSMDDPEWRQGQHREWRRMEEAA